MQNDAWHLGFSLVDHDGRSWFRRGRGSRLWQVGTLTQGVRVAIVGSRKATAAQFQRSWEIAHALAQAGAVVVSGGAVGVDAAGLRGALAAGGATVAWPGSGLGNPHPQQHRALYRAMIDQGGALLSALASDQPARPQWFLQRNRMIASGIDALIAVCAGPQSGTLHAAHQAGRLGVPVFAVPWPSDMPLAAGTAELLAQGAYPIAGPQGIPELIASLPTLEPIAAFLKDKTKSYSPRLPGLPVSDRTPHTPRKIDAAQRARPCYDAAPAPAGKPELLQPGEQALLALLQTAEPPGLSAEELACGLGQSRQAVVEMALQLTLRGLLRRGPGGVLSVP